jgi:hypothetical protein
MTKLDVDRRARLMKYALAEGIATPVVSGKI